MENCPNKTCQEHFRLRVEQIEKEIQDIKSKLGSTIKKEDVDIRLNYMEKELERLKSDSDTHYKDNSALQQTLARLEELTKYLKESLEMNQKNTMILVEKVDKMYELMLAGKVMLSAQKEEPKNEIQIINDSNKNVKEEKSSNDKIAGYLKANSISILLLIVFVIYLVTGKWVEIPK